MSHTPVCGIREVNEIVKPHICTCLSIWIGMVLPKNWLKLSLQARQPQKC